MTDATTTFESISPGSPGKMNPHRKRHDLTPDPDSLILVMVGLPARGKSFISKKLERFLRWRGQASQQRNELISHPAIPRRFTIVPT